MTIIGAGASTRSGSGSAPWRHALRMRDLLRLAALLGVAAAILTVFVWRLGVPIAGDLWITHRIQETRGLERNAALINGLVAWRWLPFGIVTVLLVFGRRIDGGRIHRSKARAEALFAFAAVIALAYGDTLLKDAVESPRPLAALGVRIDEVAGGYGFPSGHVYGAILCFGAMAAFAPLWVHRRLVVPVRAVLWAIVLLAGPARVAVGAHWPSDVAGGYLWGGFALCLALAFGRWVMSRAA